MSKTHGRLYVRGQHLSYQRGKRISNPNVSIIKIDGVNSKEETQFYLGKRVAYLYKAKKEVRGTKVRVIWGKITRPHGNSGCVRARFHALSIEYLIFEHGIETLLYIHVQFINF
ncbi:hypothetical protein MERGE_001996 [Pneumocystis wakefieldiae]|uniref:60S ribosomal protein L33-A n=1 Tax=Pneumocystis wakefieldiae TaxID=38082 RepID=A0A899FWM3_9ASCO|nr:hypothetical protein MERGE_001996 [Pneumocystis wakefieldiae]